ncbi:hypothetical protein VN97_g8508 [Penicillium thymicola]|uniref:Uncharacterized protein n=1 Tax=Penicillium thymicola TaxID=293382 RepID=A0AAI9TD87_PENTH|nr:hypothetical protein VN97_g8508 [Penicillium thymicola]
MIVQNAYKIKLMPDASFRRPYRLTIMLKQFNLFLSSKILISEKDNSPLIHTTYDHRVWKTGLPVRSAVLKPHAGELVVGWVTTSESSLLYVFVFVCFGYIDLSLSISDKYSLKTDTRTSSLCCGPGCLYPRLYYTTYAPL